MININLIKIEQVSDRLRIDRDEARKALLDAVVEKRYKEIPALGEKWQLAEDVLNDFHNEVAKAKLANK